jgi:hypothetical protein
MSKGNKTKSSQRRAKKPYKKPMLRPIKLSAGEVLGTGCKTTVGTGSGFTPCISGCNLGGS